MRTVRLQVVAGNIVLVRSSPLDPVLTAPSLMAVAPQGPAAWQFKQKKGEATLSTVTLNATVSLATEGVTFTDKKGNVLLAEPAGRGVPFVPVQATGQTLVSPDDEGLYGPGQHQNEMMDYKGQQVDLIWNNTDVAVPFLLSIWNYGILWDNYPVTKASNSRDDEPLNIRKPYLKEGHEGRLMATYVNKNKPSGVLFQRSEPVTQYHFPEDQKNFLAGLKLRDALVAWEGSTADQLMSGPSLLMNPVTDYRALSREVYLPAATGWFYFYSGKTWLVAKPSRLTRR